MMGRKALLVCLLVLSVAAFASASNMGFKITIPLVVGGTSQNWFSLPYNNSYATASAIKNDIGAANVGSVYRWNTATDNFTSYTSSRIGTDFAIEAGKAYMVNMISASTVNWVVVGSHNPALDMEIVFAGSTQNWVSVPYHSTSTNASMLKDEMIADGLSIGSVYRWNVATDNFTSYTSSRIGTNFTLTPGVGYMVTITAATTNRWTPAHY